MGDYEMMMSEHENVMDRVWLNDIASEAAVSFGSKLCEVIGDYHIIDANNGFYELWYVNPHDDNDEFISEHETLYEASFTAQFHVEIDRAWDSK